MMLRKHLNLKSFMKAKKTLEKNASLILRKEQSEAILQNSNGYLGKK